MNTVAPDIEEFASEVPELEPLPPWEEEPDEPATLSLISHEMSSDPVDEVTMVKAAPLLALVSAVQACEPTDHEARGETVIAPPPVAPSPSARTLEPLGEPAQSETQSEARGETVIGPPPVAPLPPAQPLESLGEPAEREAQSETRNETVIGPPPVAPLLSEQDHELPVLETMEGLSLPARSSSVRTHQSADNGVMPFSTHRYSAPLTSASEPTEATVVGPAPLGLVPPVMHRQPVDAIASRAPAPAPGPVPSAGSARRLGIILAMAGVAALVLGALIGWSLFGGESGDSSTNVAAERSQLIPTAELDPTKVVLAPVTTPGQVEVRAPEGARVEVDHEDRGEAPVKLELSPGMHSIRVTASDHHAWERTFEVRSGTSVVVKAGLVPAEHDGPRPETKNAAPDLGDEDRTAPSVSKRSSQREDESKTKMSKTKSPKTKRKAAPTKPKASPTKPKASPTKPKASPTKPKASPTKQSQTKPKAPKTKPSRSRWFRGRSSRGK